MTIIQSALKETPNSNLPINTWPNTEPVRYNSKPLKWYKILATTPPQPENSTRTKSIGSDAGNGSADHSPYSDGNSNKSRENSSVNKIVVLANNAARKSVARINNIENASRKSKKNAFSVNRDVSDENRRKNRAGSRNIRNIPLRENNNNSNIINNNNKDNTTSVPSAYDSAATAASENVASAFKSVASKRNNPNSHLNSNLNLNSAINGFLRAPNHINQEKTLLQVTKVATATTTTKTTTTTTTTTTARIDYILITDYDQLKERTFWQKYGRILLTAVGISLGVACISVLLVAVHCFRAAALTRRSAAGALALPIPLSPEDQTLLNTEPEHPVPMLSVQSAGNAGLERLGVPTRTSINTPPDDRGQFSCRLRVDTHQARELFGETVIRSSNTNTNSSNTFFQQQQQQQQQQHHDIHSHLHPHNQQQQHYQRMSTAPNSGSGSGNTSAPRGNKSISGSGGGNGNGNNNNNRPTPSMTNTNNNNNPGSNVARSSDSGCAKGGAGVGGGGSSMGSSCGGSSLSSHSHDHHQHYQQQLQQQQTPRCPHHVPLPDSEWGQDRNLQIRTGYQQSEITRTYIRPPPNKSVKDVPEQSSSYNFYSLSASSTLHSGGSSATLSSQQQQHFSSSSHAATAAASSTQQPKSKPNVIAKLFSRKSSPKSPTTLSASSTCSSLASSASLSSMLPSASSSASSISSAASVSASSSSSSLSAAPLPLSALPVSSASALLKTTVCNYGPSLAAQQSSPSGILAGLAPSTQLLTTIGVSPTATAAAALSASAERIPSPPLSVSVPIATYQQQQQQHHFQQQHRQYQQQQQQLLLDSIVAESATPTTSLQMLKSSSCSSTSSLSSSQDDMAAMDCSPTSRGRTTPTNVAGNMSRNSGSNANISAGGQCNCNNKNCNKCSAT